MKKIYKVYAQCVIRPRGKAIVEITEQEARDLISEAIDEMLNMGGYFDIDCETDDELCVAYDAISGKAIEFFEEHEYFECGDFIVIASEDYPTRSGSYGWTDEF